MTHDSWNHTSLLSSVVLDSIPSILRGWSATIPEGASAIAGTVGVGVGVDNGVVGSVFTTTFFLGVFFAFLPVPVFALLVLVSRESGFLRENQIGSAETWNDSIARCN